MPPKPEQDERLDEMPSRHQRLSDQIQNILVNLTQMTTVVQRHVGEQQGINAHLTKLLQRHEDRIQTLEQFKAVMDATLPKDMLNPAVVHEELKELRKEQRWMRYQLTAISLGAGVVVWFLSWLIPLIFNHYFHFGT